MLMGMLINDILVVVFQLFSSGEKLQKVAGQSEQVKMDHLKGSVDCFSYSSLIFSYFIF
jgi:hypothetical protein